MKQILKQSCLLLYQEAALLTSFTTAILFFLFNKSWFTHINELWVLFVLFTWLFAAILAGAFAVVRHAEELAKILKEPYGTLILTLAVISIEVAMISSVMLTGENNPMLARDTMYSVIMIVLNGMIGLCLLLGGLRYHEQSYNLQGSNAFLSVILLLAVLGLIMPSFTQATHNATFSVPQQLWVIIITISIYGIFLAIQTMRHSAHFVHPTPAGKKISHPPTEQDGKKTAKAYLHTFFLIVYLIPIVYLAKKIAFPIDYALHELHLPLGLGGMAIAILILTPEALGAIRASLANELQRSVNLSMGSVLATIGLTIPAVLIIGLFTGKTVILGLDPAHIILLMLSLLTCTLTFSGSRTNILQGAVHLVLFGIYILLIFD